MIKTDFYFLVNALPDITTLDADAINEVRLLIEANLHGNDIEAFRFLLYRNDNKNLLNLMRKRDGILPKMAERFYTPAVFSFEDLDDMLIDEYDDDAHIPDYLAAFLSEEKNASWSLRERENRLIELYYEAGVLYPQEFIRTLFVFKRDLKNIMLALNARMQGFKITRVTIGEYDLPSLLAASSQTDFGLSGVHEYIPELLRLLEEAKLVELEHLLDKLLLQYGSSLAEKNIFSLNYVLHYFLELMLLHRWHRLTPQQGAECLEQTMEEIIRMAGRPFSAELS